MRDIRALTSGAARPVDWAERRSTDAQDYVLELARVNRNGAGFLLAYGITWLVAAELARWFGERVSTIAALLQGMVGSPIGLSLTRVVAEGSRPDDPTLNDCPCT